jgi:hypothetical protein
MSAMSDFVERVAQEFNLVASKYEPQAALFSPAIPFTRQYTAMEGLTVTEPVEFTPDAENLFLGGVTFLAVTSDGENVPTFSGISTSGTYNEEEGAVNLLFFSYLGFGIYICNILPGTVVEAVAPTIESALVNNTNPDKIVCTMSEALDETSVSAGSAFAVTGKTITTVEIDGDTLTLTVDEDFIEDEVIELSYTQPVSNKIKDLAGNLLANVVDFAVTNSIGIDFTLSGIDRTDNDFTSTASGDHRGVSVQSAAGDCAIEFDVDTAMIASNIIAGLKTESTPGAFSEMDYGVFLSSDNKYYTNPASAGFSDAGVTTMDGDRIKFEKIGVEVTVSYYRSASWTVLTTYSVDSVTPLYIAFDFLSHNKTLQNLVTEGFA